MTKLSFCLLAMFACLGCGDVVEECDCNGPLTSSGGQQTGGTGGETDSAVTKGHKVEATSPCAPTSKPQGIEPQTMGGAGPGGAGGMGGSESEGLTLEVDGEYLLISNFTHSCGDLCAASETTSAGMNLTVELCGGAISLCGNCTGDLSIYLGGVTYPLTVSYDNGSYVQPLGTIEG
jgi:hypothetical protein